MKKQIIGLTIIILVSVLSFPKVITRPGGFMQLYPVTPNQGIIISANGNVGIGTTPSVKLDVAGTISASALVVNGSIATSVSQNTASGVITVTLPTASTCKGRQYSVKKTDGTVNTVRVLRGGSDTIDEALDRYLFSQYQYVVLMSDGGTNWDIVGGN